MLVKNKNPQDKPAISEFILPDGGGLDSVDINHAYLLTIFTHFQLIHLVQMVWKTGDSDFPHVVLTIMGDERFTF